MRQFTYKELFYYNEIMLLNLLNELKFSEIFLVTQQSGIWLN